MSRGVIVALCLALALWIFQGKKRERFLAAANEMIPLSNTGNEPWQHHPANSIPMEQRIKYEKMYMVEMDNADFERYMRKALQVPDKKSNEVMNISNWTILDTNNSLHTSFIRVSYASMILYIEKTLNSSDLMKLPYDTEQRKIQVVHDVLLEFKKNVQNDFKYILLVDLILYREHKFHGKHVQLEVLVEYVKEKKQWLFDVIRADVLGIVSEDGIGLFPVVPFTELESGYTDILSASGTKVLSDNDTVIETLKRQNELHFNNVSSELAIL